MPQTRTLPAAAPPLPPSVLLVTASTAPCISPQSDWLQTKLLQTKLDAAERRGWGFWSASDRDGDGADAASSAGRCADAARLLPLLAPVPALERYGWLLYVDPELAVTGADALDLPWARLAEPTTDVLLWGEERTGGVVVDPGVMLVRRGDASVELFGAVLDACAASADATTRDAFQQLLRSDAGGWRRRVALAPELRLVADWRQVVPRLRSGERALGEALWGSTTPPFATSFRGCAALCALDGDDEPPARGAACRAALLRVFTFGAAPRLGAVGVEHVRLGSLHARPAANTTAWMAHRDRLAGCLPALHIVGAQRAGLGSLHWTLRRGWHKGLATNAGDRELHFFSMDNRYRQGLLWYQQRFYPTSDALRRCDAAADAARAVEVSSSYFDYPRSALRLFAVAPHARVAVVLREPVERAVSAFNLRWLTWLCGKLIWQLPRCWEGVTSEAAVKENQVGPFQVHAALKVWRACAPGDGKAPEKKCLEADYLSKLRNKSTTELRDLRRCQQAANRSYGGGGGVAPPVDWEGCLGLTGAMMGPKQVHKAMEDSSFVYRSMYATHLRRWVRHFGAEQLLVLGASRLLSDDRTVRAAEMGRLAAHAGVARAAELVHDSVLDEASPGAKAKGMRAGAFENSREYLLRAPADVTRATAQWLAPHNCELAALLRAHGLAASASLDEHPWLAAAAPACAAADAAAAKASDDALEDYLRMPPNARRKPAKVSFAD